MCEINGASFFLPLYKFSFPKTGSDPDSMSSMLTKHRYHVIPSVLHYWLTDPVRNWNQASEFLHSGKPKNIILNLTSVLKLLITIIIMC